MAAAQGTPTKPGRRPVKIITPKKSQDEQDGVPRIKLSDLNENNEKFILRARVTERCQLHETSTKEKKQLNLVRFLLADDTGSILATAFQPKAEQLHAALKLGCVYDFFIQKAYGDKAKNPVSKLGVESVKKLPSAHPPRVHFELSLRQAKPVLVDKSCPTVQYPMTTFVKNIQSRLDVFRKLSAFQQVVEKGRFNIMGIVKDIYEFCTTEKEEKEQGNQFDLVDQSCEEVGKSGKSGPSAAATENVESKNDNSNNSDASSMKNDPPEEDRSKGSVAVKGVGAEVVKTLAPGSIVILIGVWIEHETETIISDNDGWIEVIEPNFNKQALDLREWFEAKEKDAKKKKLA